MNGTAMRDEKKKLVEDGFASVDAAADFLMVARSTIYNLMGSGELPFAKFGKCRRIPWRSLREYAQRCMVTV